MADLTAFDGDALISALDAQRADRQLNWNSLADELWGQSALLNAELADNCLCPGALVRTAKRGTMSCQYALIILRWLGRAPEEFLTGPNHAVGRTALPQTDAHHRLRWDLNELYAALNERRRELCLPWTALAEQLTTTTSRLTNLRTARLADMDLTMRITQWLGRPAADFVHATTW